MKAKLTILPVILLASTVLLGCPTRTIPGWSGGGGQGGAAGNAGTDASVGGASAGGTGSAGHAGTNGRGGIGGAGGVDLAGAAGASGGAAVTGLGGSGAAGGGSAGSAGGAAGTGGSGGTGGGGAGGKPAVCQQSATQCSSGSLETCDADGQWGRPVACDSGQVCERSGTDACLDPNWPEWPMPNGQSDVGAGAPNRESYTDNGDGTTSDNVTGLMWQKEAYTTRSLTTSEGLAYCATLPLDGYSDWRLPSLIELISIVDYSDSTPAIDAGHFLVVSSGTFLTSTVSGPGGEAFAVSFGDGSIFPSAQIGGYVLCVR